MRASANMCALASHASIIPLASQCCLKCPGGVCTKACNKMLLKEIFDKMYEQNKARIKKLEFFMKENKKRINKSEDRIEKYVVVCCLLGKPFFKTLRRLFQTCAHNYMNANIA